MRLRQQLCSLILPVTVVVIVPFLKVARFHPLRLQIYRPVPFVQFPLGVLVFCAGLLLVVITVRLLITKGDGTLAPWSPTRKLVIEGVYRYVRNPMISGVLLMLVGEAVVFGSRGLVVWALAFALANTVYFRYHEEPGLAKRFGRDYGVYKQHVRRWIPRLHPWVGDDVSAHGNDEKP